MRKLLLGFMCSIGILLSACQHSPHKNYYLLSAPAPAGQTTTSNLGTNLIGVGPISIADYLTRSQIVYTEANNLIVSENDYWGEPLDKGIARVLIANLAQRNSARSFVEFPWRSDSRPTQSVRVQILQLNCTSGQATLDAIWDLVDNTSKALVQRRHFVRSLSASTAPEAIAQAYSSLVRDLADDINSTLPSAQ